MNPPDYPFPGASPMEPPPRLAEVRASEPISRVTFAGEPAWLLTRHADVREAIAEPGLVSFFPGLTTGSDGERAAAGEGGFLMMMSGDRHARLRRTLSGALGARRVAAQRPAAEATARRLAAVLADAGGGDLLADFGAPLAIAVLGELIGVDVTARDDFARWSDDSVAMFDETDPARMAEAAGALFGFIGELVAAERDGGGLIGDLFRIPADPGGGMLTEAEVNGLVGQLLMAGYQPMAIALGLAAHRLLVTPDAVAAVRADPELWPGVVDELLRLDPGGGGTVDRTFRARADVEIGGVRMGAGEVVVASLGAANRDPEVFPDPDRLDPRRRPNPHVAFFPGPHHCLGAALARLVLQVGLGALLELPVAPELVGDAQWRSGAFGERQLGAVPVTVRDPAMH